MLNPTTMAEHGFGYLARRHAVDRYTASRAFLLAAPDNVARIQALASTHGHLLTADMLARSARQELAEVEEHLSP